MLSQLQEHATHDKGHGRVETRHVRTLPVLHPIPGWPSIRQIGQLTRTRFIVVSGEESIETTCYITDLDRNHLQADEFANLIRNHWRIENHLHWQRDLLLNEDRATQRTRNGPDNLSSIRSAVLTLIHKQSNKIKETREKCAMNIMKTIFNMVN